MAETDYADGFSRVGELNNGYFPLVDFHQDNTVNLISLKTTDPASPTAVPRLQDHIDDLSSRGATVNGQPANMILDVRVPPGTEGELASLIDYGNNLGVTVQIASFGG